MTPRRFIEAFVLALMVMGAVTAVVVAVAAYFPLRDWSSWAAVILGIVSGFGAAVPLASIAIVVSLLVSIEERIAPLTDDVRGT